MKSYLRMGLALILGLNVIHACLCAKDQETTLAAVRVVTDYQTADSLTAGIQEAIDSLTATGGVVYIPEGTYLLQTCIILKEKITLRGAGKGTVLRKAPVFMVKLAEDAKKGQEFIVVDDASRLKPGMGFFLGQDGIKARFKQNMYFVTQIENNKVHARGWYMNGLVHDCSVAQNARLLAITPAIIPAQYCAISNLELDGAWETQMPEEAVRLCNLQTIAHGIYPVGLHAKIERCWIHDFLYDGIQVNAHDSYAVIRDCHLYSNRWNGVHVGGGPRTWIVNNQIYGNRQFGVNFCAGNRALIVSGNFIHDNWIGIGGLHGGVDTTGKIPEDQTADRLAIITQNHVYRNSGPGISTVGSLAYDGPENCVISENIIENNCLNRASNIPAGIQFVNARGCVISNNRIVDDQDAYPRPLINDAKAGENTIQVGCLPDDRASKFTPFLSEKTPCVLEDLRGRELFQITNVSISGRESRIISLDRPLPRDFPLTNNARIRGVKSQGWGVACFERAKSELNSDNIIANNAVKGNQFGGILWSGAGNVVSANSGTEVKLNPGLSLWEQVYPAGAQLALKNAGFESNREWTKDKNVVYDKITFRRGKCSLKFSINPGEGVASAHSSGTYLLAPGPRYRVSGWVKTAAKNKLGAPVMPFVALKSGDQTLVNSSASQLDVAESNAWQYMSGSLMISNEQHVAVVLSLAADSGEAWVDDVKLEQLDW